MSSFIIPLLIVSVVGLMVQSAPVSVTDDHLQKRQATTIKKEIQKTLERRLFQTAGEVYNTAGMLLNEAVSLNVSADYTGATGVNKDLEYHKLYCIHFIMAMSLKHHLQDHLLDTNVISQRTNASIENLSVSLTNLQTMANTLDNLQVNKQGSSCPRFTPENFKTIYKYIPYTNTSLLQAVHDMARYWYDSNPKKYDHLDVLQL